MSPQLRKITLLFILSIVVTAVFSTSLRVFFADQSWTEVLGKGLLIPCFTWTVLLILSAIYLPGKRRLDYWEQLGFVCLVGSIALLPAALYNFAVAGPLPLISIINVLGSVVIMCFSLYSRLKARKFNRVWAFGWMATIIFNMMLYIYSISRV